MSAPTPIVLDAPTAPLDAQVAVIGSGPGGAITAALLAEAGRDVLLIEEGAFLQLESCTPFTLDEMVQKYRNGGITPALGPTPVAYVEGRCVGGGSEINSGLYHRTPPEVLERWRKEFQVEAIADADLSPHFEACERDVSVSRLPGAAPAASLKLHDGATKLGWKSLEIPRWFKYDGTSTSPNSGSRQSMTRTFVPRFLAAGGRLLPKSRIRQLRSEGDMWLASGSHADGTRVEVRAETVFVCGGAVQTPALLRRSGIKGNVGNSLQLHPTVKLTARFRDRVNASDMGVPVHQVKEFAPRLSFGCSISALPYLELAMSDHPAHLREVTAGWERMAIYYAMIVSGSQGSVRAVPGFGDPLVRYRLTPEDMKLLAEGLAKLAEMLFASGAEALFPSVRGVEPFRSMDDVRRLPSMLPHGRTNLMTIHLFSSCPMGENRDVCAADSFGRVRGMKGLHIADASLLCTAPGVNPQGSVMAFARRNVLNFLGRG